MQSVNTVSRIVSAWPDVRISYKQKLPARLRTLMNSNADEEWEQIKLEGKLTADFDRDSRSDVH